MAQIQYWNQEFQPTREKNATYYSDEGKNDTAKIRTFFLLDDKLKVRQIVLNKRGFVTHEIFFYPSSQIERETFFSKRGSKLRRRDYSETGILTRHVVYNKRGNETSSHRYYDNGALLMERSGRTVKWFNEDGSPRQQAIGDLNGTFVYTYPSGQKKAELTFQYGSLKQPEYYWYPNGQMRTIIPPTPFAERHYYPTGQLAFQKDSVLSNGDKMSFRWDTGGTLRQQIIEPAANPYQDLIYFYANGQKSVEGREKKRKRVGVWTFYQPNGELWFTIDKDQEQKLDLGNRLKDLPVSSREAIDLADLMFVGTPQIDDVVWAEEEPRPLNMDQLKPLIGYPQISRDKGIEGTVVVRVLVDEEGNGVRYKLIRKVHPSLNNAVERHIYKLTFSPAVQNGKAVPFWLNIPFNFKLLN